MVQGIILLYMISLFNSLPTKGSKHISDDVIDMPAFLSYIKDGKWKHLVEPIRNEVDKTKRNSLKRNLPSVTIAGVFKEREQDKLITHSGFICIDIDSFNDKSELACDKYTYAIFNSASGNGIAIIVKINPDKHKESYNWLADYYYTTYGISVDPAPKNVASLRYVSYDADIFINEKAIKAKVKSDEVKKPKSLPIVLSDSVIDTLVNEVRSSGKNIAADYDSYLKLGFALANGFGERGRSFYHSICFASNKYHSEQCDKQYNICLRGANKSGITVGTFYWMLKDNGFTLPKPNQKAIQIASIAKKAKRTKEGVVEQLKVMEGMSDEDATQIATQVFDRSDMDLNKVAADPERLIESLIEFLKLNHPIKYNVITRKLEEQGNEVSEERKNTIYLKSKIIFNSDKITKDLVFSILHSDLIPNYNPITEYIERNRHRNTTGNIEALVKSIKTDTENHEMFISKWLVSIIAAYDYNPVRSVLIFCGTQNTGKTEWFRRLLPSALQKYYAESKLDAGKDDELLMCEKLIVMDDEMGGKSKQDEKLIKELSSKTKFSLRAAYGRNNQDYNRLAILCGTSNTLDVISDPTGNTRILPINILEIDHESYNAVNKDELFMELVRIYESGFDWKLNKSELKDLDNVGHNFEVTNFEYELISKFFIPAFEGSNYDFLSTAEIKDCIESNSRQKINNIRKFSIELSKFFGKSDVKKVNGSNKRGYYVVKLIRPVTYN
jgi:hypothetical protein